MAKGKQANYLASLLSDEPDADAGTLPDASDGSPISAGPSEPAERPRTGMTLLGRESALARIASGEVKQVTRISVDPARVRVWPGNPRRYSELNEENTRELIDSILAENGQKIPVVLRKLKDDASHDFELIIGSRRHFAISWLRAHNYPDFKLLADLADIDDETAFRLADLENRARKDISDIERARSYAQALKAHYAGHQARMAERLRVSQSWLSKTLKVASIPDAVLAAFAALTDVQIKPAYGLAVALDDRGRARQILDAAKGLAAEQAGRRRRQEPPVPAAEVFKRLLDTGTAEKATNAPLTYQSRFGRNALSILTANRQGVTIRLHPGSGADHDELAEALRAALADLESQGRGLIR